MGRFSEITSNALAAKILKDIEAEFNATTRMDATARQILVRLAEKALALNEWTIPKDQEALVERLKYEASLLNGKA